MKKNKKPFVIMLVGPNGAGKSTFYQKFLEKDTFFNELPFVNADIIATELAVSPEDFSSQLARAGKITSATLQKYISQQQSFIYETTAAGCQPLNLLKTAKENNFDTAIIAIELSSPELSFWRVFQRVSKGGHYVPSEDIERRYPRILKNMPNLIMNSDLSIILDNSAKKSFRPILMCSKKQTTNFNFYPKWLKGVLAENQKFAEFLSSKRNRKSSQKPKSAICSFLNKSINR